MKLLNRESSGESLAFNCKYILLFLGFGSFIRIQAIGKISIAEISLLIIAPVLLFRDKSFSLGKYGFKLIVLLALWLAFAIFTDYVRNTSFVDYSRGIAKVGFLLLSVFVALRLISFDWRSVKFYFLGAGVSMCLSQLLTGDAIDVVAMSSIRLADSNWTHSYNYAVNFCLISITFFSFAKYPLLSLLMTFLIGSINVYLGSRATGSLELIAIVAVLMGRISIKNKIKMFTGSSLVSFLKLFCIVVSGWFFYFAYQQLAKNSMLGELSQAKYYAQSEASGGMIIGGRLGFLGGLLAVKDSPFIGYGSWAIDTGGYMAQAAELQNLNSFDYRIENWVDDQRIPAHSHVLEAWTEHGFGGGLFWIVMVVIYFKAIVRLSLQLDRYSLALWLVLLQYGWSIFLSPIHDRMYEGILIALTCSIASYRSGAVRYVYT